MKRFAVPFMLLLPACASPRPAPQPPQQKQLTEAVSAPVRLAPPEHMSGTARALLRTRMAGHASNMSELVAAIMILDYPQIAARAAEIRDDARLARPLTGDATELNSMLPEKFFVHQDELRAQAQRLVAAAERSSAVQVADAYGELSGTCVRCHAAYRASPPP